MPKTAQEFYRCQDGTCRGSGIGWWLCVKTATLGFMVGKSFMGWSSFSYSLDENRVGCRLG
jgi:hypothetical protein